MGLWSGIKRLARTAVSASTWSQSSPNGVGGYTATDPRRKILGWNNRPGNATANELLTASLPSLRAWCRHLERNNPSARAGVEALVALVVGTGISLEPDTGDEAVDKLIREQWNLYVSSCSVTGCDLYHLQNQGFRDVPVAGEMLWRFVVLPERAKAGLVPVAVMPLEAEWLDERTSPTSGVAADGTMRVGPITYDQYGRPVSYRLRNPELLLGGESEEVPADQVVHEFERRRALQGRGEPWLAPIVETLQQERDLVDAELKSAVNTSAMAMVVTSEYHDMPDTTEDGTEDDPAQAIRLGTVARMYPGEDVKAFSHDRPSQQIKPFREMLRGDIAAALRIPSRFLDRDVSRANYSSMRADMLDTDRLLAPVREWYGHATAGRLYKKVLPFLAIKAGIPVPKRSDYRLLPDGQPYVDPEKDARAASLLIAAGLTTYEKEVAKRGEDYRKVWEQRKKENALAEQLGLTLDLSSTNAPAPQSTIGKQPEADTANQPAGQQGDPNAD